MQLLPFILISAGLRGTAQNAVLQLVKVAGSTSDVPSDYQRDNTYLLHGGFTYCSPCMHFVVCVSYPFRCHKVTWLVTDLTTPPYSGILTC